MAQQPPRVPGSARLGLFAGEWDPGWWMLLVLHKAGLVWALRLPESLPARAELVACDANARAGVRASCGTRGVMGQAVGLALAHAGSAVAEVVTVTIGVASGPPGITLRQLLGAAAEKAMAGKVSEQRNRVHAVRLRDIGPPA